MKRERFITPGATGSLGRACAMGISPTQRELRGVDRKQRQQRPCAQGAAVSHRAEPEQAGSAHREAQR